jgi:hypothetical protein
MMCLHPAFILMENLFATCFHACLLHIENFKKLPHSSAHVNRYAADASISYMNPSSNTFTQANKHTVHQQDLESVIIVLHKCILSA